MNVRELIKHLQTLNPELEVYYRQDFDGYYKATEEEFKQYTLAEDDGNGKDFECLMVGDVQ